MLTDSSWLESIDMENIEQVNTLLLNNYSSKSDLYSFGVTILDILIKFSTEMEKMILIDDMRNGNYEKLNKLVQVIKVKDITTRPCVERELMLVKVASSPKIRYEMINIVEIFRSKIVDISDFSMTIEVTGDPGKISTILQLLRPYRIIEIVRTGKISLERELGINSEAIRNI